MTKINAWNRVFGAAVVAAALLSVLPGCKKEGGSADSGSGGGDGGTKSRQVHKAPDGAALKFAFVTNNASEFWLVAEAGVRKYEKENPGQNVHVDVKMPPTGTVQEQNQIVEDLLAQGYNGIAISPIAPADQTRILNKAAAQTNLICQDSDAPKSNRLVYIGTDNYEAGKALGERIVKLMPNGGKMAVFVGTFSADNARQRLRGVEDAIKDKNITIAARKEDNKDQGKARSNVNDVLTAQPDVTMLVGLWSYNGPQIAAAIDNANKKGQVQAAVFDDEVATLAAIEKGTVACTVVQRQFDFGYQAAKMMYDLATKGDAALPQQEVIPTGVEIIDASNLADFRDRMKTLKSGGSPAPTSGPSSAPAPAAAAG